MRKVRAATVSLAALLGCAHTTGHAVEPERGKLISPSLASEATTWTGEEQARPSALRNLRRSPEASFHLLRVKEAHPARVHERSDLVLVSVAGALALEVDGEDLTLRPGDVLEVPRQTPYSLRNQATEASTAYLVFTPPLDARDDRPLESSKRRESAWKWNLWVQ